MPVQMRLWLVTSDSCTKHGRDRSCYSWRHLLTLYKGSLVSNSESCKLSPDPLISQWNQVGVVSPRHCSSSFSPCADPGCGFSQSIHWHFQRNVPFYTFERYWRRKSGLNTLEIFQMSAVNKESSDCLLNNRQFHRNKLCNNLAFFYVIQSHTALIIFN